MARAQTGTVLSTVGFFGYLLGHGLLCIPLLLWAVMDHAGHAVVAKLSGRLDRGVGG